jgi:phage terminase small subunit
MPRGAKPHPAHTGGRGGPKDELGLTIKERRFVEEYFIDLNAVAAATRAGYAGASARHASEILKRPRVTHYIDAHMEKISERTRITQDRVLKELARIGFSDLRSLVGESGELKSLNELDEDDSAAISAIEVVTKKIPGVGDEPATIEYIHKVRMWDKVNALTQIARIFAWLKDRTEISGDPNAPLQVQTVRRIIVDPKKVEEE